MEMKHIENYTYFNHEDDDEIKEYEILKKFKSHNILKERVDLYKDFSLNLLYKIYDTYLGVEYIKNKKDAIGHYNWCFGKVLEEFDEQEIDFYGNDELYDYFLDYYIDQFYSLNKEIPINHHKKIWLEIFNHKKSSKSKNEVEILIELYIIFDFSLDNKHKLVEAK
jgi:hypothetical protein